MQTYNYLPGVLINTVDGGLVATTTPSSQSTLIIGTAGIGPVNQPTSVTNAATAAATFGFDGDLVQAMEEVLAYSDNVILFRMGTTPQVLSGIGAVLTGGGETPGFSVTFGQNSATVNTDYSIWYNAGIIAIWYQGNIVFSNSTVYGAVDTGDVNFSQDNLSAFLGLQLGTGSTPALVNAISVQAATALSATSPEAAPTITPAVTGLGLTGRETYVAFKQATELLQGLQIDQVYVPAATIDAPNVAFYVSSDATTVANNPATNPDALDWLKTTFSAVDGSKLYQWASETQDSGGNTVTAMTAVTPPTRIAAGFYEVNWGYALADFAADVSGLSSTCLAIIGTSAPKSFKLVDVRNWIGALPTYGTDGVTPIAYGRGLLGCPYLTGTTSSKLNNLCFDFATGYRLPGFYQNSAEQYDGGADLDSNQNPIDIGAYVHVVGDQAILTNGFAANYTNNIAGVVAGYLSSLDQKSALTNKQLLVTQINGLVYTPGQLDALTQAKVNVLRTPYVNAGSKSPALLHDMTAANASSDYTLVLRMRIKGLVVATLLNRANSYIGQSSLDGLTMQALQTALDKDLVNLSTRGYINTATVTITSTLSQQRIGHANLYLKFNPANELVQLTAFVGITQ
jgi:hypothetical protein